MEMLSNIVYSYSQAMPLRALLLHIRFRTSSEPCMLLDTKHSRTVEKKIDEKLSTVGVAGVEAHAPFSSGGDGNGNGNGDDEPIVIEWL